MRDIKFRGYDKEYEKMTYFDNEDYILQNVQVLRSEVKYNYDYNREDWSYEQTDKVELMQYTGLHDKNGKEIYEGDIVKVLINGIWYIGQVIYEYSGFTIDVTNNKQLEFGRRGIIEKFTEVIGNIYDNPNLLKGE